MVHQNTIKLSDFGLSRRLDEISNFGSNIFGTVPYIDPQLFRDQKANKKSDVYSVGVLLWEISSGKKPFDSCDSSQAVILSKILVDGIRETPIPGTPIDYINLYTSMKLIVLLYAIIFINVSLRVL